MSHQAWRTGFPSLASSLAFMFSLLVCLLYIATYALLLFAFGRPGALHVDRRVGGKRMVICDVSSLGVSSSSGVVWLPALKDRHGSTRHEWASRGLTSSKSTLRVKVGCACGHDLNSKRGLKLEVKAWDEGSPGDSHARGMLLRKLRSPGPTRRTEDRRHGRGKI